MSTGTALLGQLSSASEARTKQEFVTLLYALRGMPSPSDLPKDEIGREIALLLWEHRDIADRLGPINLWSLSADEKRSMLASVKEMLGIKPIRRRHLGYVGP